MKHPCLLLLTSLFCTGLLQAQPHSLAESLQQMKVANGFTTTIVASEPEIRQPLSVSFDSRGRMWVIQYLQYPAPAGLKPVKVDQYLRTTYDRVPEPPPHGPRGADRITICEDTDGDGRMDKFKDFVAGLNLCSGMALGYGGVFVVQAPYLLFYADKNHDDIPDSNPEVLLTGFGMEDAHALANSLTWGPDGWLYGAQGSTVTANIRGIEFQQGIWRYHPVTRKFELFAEGGGNTWGMDFDSDGEIFAGTNYYEKMLHMRQGAYYVKNFGKHGALHNPHAYGYFEHVPFSGYKGLHISIGGIIYHGGAFGDELEGKYIFANTLDRAVYWANLQPQGSTFTSSFGGTLLKTDNELFRPIDCTVGPDGAVYVADWCDKRATHVDPLDTWDRSNGRIYKIQKTSATHAITKPRDLEKLSSKELVGMLSNTNDWFVREARRILGERRDQKIVPQLRQEVFARAEKQLQVESLWALQASGGFDAKTALKCLQHTNETVRKWAVRFVGDQGKISGDLRPALQTMARTEPSPIVRAQLACSLRRLPAADSTPILHQLLLRAEDSEDPHLPLLLWWVMEGNAIRDRAGVLQMFADEKIWKSPLVQKHILQRIARRYAAEGQREDFESCAELLNLSTRFASNQPTASHLPAEAERLLKGINEAIAGRTLIVNSPALAKWFSELPPEPRTHRLVIEAGVRIGLPEFRETALGKVRDEKSNEEERVALIETVAEAHETNLISAFFTIVETSHSERVRSAALSALQQLQAPEIAAKVLAFYQKLDPALRGKAVQLLAVRPTSALLLVAAVEHQEVSPKEVSMDQVRQMAGFKNSDLTPRLQKIWGKFQTDSPAEKQNFINQVKLILKPSGAAGREPKPSIEAGKKLFQQTCAACHKLYGEGNVIGPDLTGVDRKDINALLTNIINPSAYIRNEYVSYELETKEDEVLSGLLVDSSATSVTILDRNNQRRTVARERIKSLNESAISLMPEGLLEPLQPQQLIDLIGYLQSK